MLATINRIKLKPLEKYLEWTLIFEILFWEGWRSRQNLSFSIIFKYINGRQMASNLTRLSKKQNNSITLQWLRLWHFQNSSKILYEISRITTIFLTPTFCFFLPESWYGRLFVFSTWSLLRFYSTTTNSYISHHHVFCAAFNSIVRINYKI